MLLVEAMCQFIAICSVVPGRDENYKTRFSPDPSPHASSSGPSADVVKIRAVCVLLQAYLRSLTRRERGGGHGKLHRAGVYKAATNLYIQGASEISDNFL